MLQSNVLDDRYRGLESYLINLINSSAIHGAGHISLRISTLFFAIGPSLQMKSTNREDETHPSLRFSVQHHLKRTDSLLQLTAATGSQALSWHPFLTSLVGGPVCAGSGRLWILRLVYVEIGMFVFGRFAVFMLRTLLLSGLEWLT